MVNERDSDLVYGSQIIIRIMMNNIDGNRKLMEMEKDGKLWEMSLMNPFIFLLYQRSVGETANHDE